MPPSTIALPGGKFDAASRELRSAAGSFPLSVRQAAFLAVLAAQPGAVVPQEAIRVMVWPDQPNLSNGSLHQLAFEIRKVFALAGLDPAVVETVPRRGYRLAVTAAVAASELPLELPSARHVNAPLERRSKRAWPNRVGALLLVACVTGAAWTGTLRIQRNGRVNALCAEGFGLIERASEPNLARANMLFRQALEMDDHSALAIAGLAEASARFGGADIPTVRLRGAEMSTFQSLAREAVRLDPSCARCQATLGYILGTRDFRVREAEAALSAAVRLDPGQWRYHAWLAQDRAALREFDSALGELEAGSRSAPVATGPLTERASVLYLMGRYAEAVDTASQAIALNPRAQPAIAWRARAHLMQHHWREYVQDRATETAIWMGWSDEAREAFAERNSSLALADGLRRMISINADNPTFSYERAFWHAVLGESNAALADLEIAVRRRPFQILFLNADPAFASLHGEPRFEAMLTTLGIAGGTSQAGERQPKL